MSFAKEALKKAIHIGYFHVHGDTMTFYRKDGYRAKDIKALGDVVYFMYVKGELYKIGKAGGASGFVGRAGTYNRGRLGDATNNRIIDVMEDIQQKDIEVYCVQIPRPVVEYTCPITGEVHQIPVSIHKDIESLYTDKYLSEDSAHELPFCNQLT
jgi:hypothetical protein